MSHPPPAEPTLEVLCPCCDSRLLVHAGTGVVLRTDRKKRDPAASFAAALEEEKERRERSDGLFDKALSSQKNQQALLDRKFEEAMKQAAEEPEGKPPHPLDWD